MDRATPARVLALAACLTAFSAGCLYQPLQLAGGGGPGSGHDDDLVGGEGGGGGDHPGGDRGAGDLRAGDLPPGGDTHFGDGYGGDPHVGDPYWGGDPVVECTFTVTTTDTTLWPFYADSNVVITRRPDHIDDVALLLTASQPGCTVVWSIVDPQAYCGARSPGRPCLATTGLASMATHTGIGLVPAETIPVMVAVRPMGASSSTLYPFSLTFLPTTGDRSYFVTASRTDTATSKNPFSPGAMSASLAAATSLLADSSSDPVGFYVSQGQLPPAASYVLQGGSFLAGGFDAGWRLPTTPCRCGGASALRWSPGTTNGTAEWLGNKGPGDGHCHILRTTVTPQAATVDGALVFKIGAGTSKPTGLQGIEVWSPSTLTPAPGALVDFELSPLRSTPALVRVWDTDLRATGTPLRGLHVWPGPSMSAGATLGFVVEGLSVSVDGGGAANDDAVRIEGMQLEGSSLSWSCVELKNVTTGTGLTVMANAVAGMDLQLTDTATAVTATGASSGGVTGIYGYAGSGTNVMKIFDSRVVAVSHGAGAIETTNAVLAWNGVEVSMGNSELHVQGTGADFGVYRSASNTSPSSSLAIGSSLVCLHGAPVSGTSVYSMSPNLNDGPVEIRDTTFDQPTACGLPDHKPAVAIGLQLEQPGNPAFVEGNLICTAAVGGASYAASLLVGGQLNRNVVNGVGCGVGGAVGAAHFGVSYRLNAQDLVLDGNWIDAGSSSDFPIFANVPNIMDSTGNLTVFNNAIAASAVAMGQLNSHSTRMDLGYNTVVLYSRIPSAFDETTIVASFGLPGGVVDAQHLVHDNLVLYAAALDTVVLPGATPNPSLTDNSFGATCTGTACAALATGSAVIPVGTGNKLFRMLALDDTICMLSSRPSLNVHLQPDVVTAYPNALWPTSFLDSVPLPTDLLGHDIDNEVRKKLDARGADTAAGPSGPAGCTVFRPETPLLPHFAPH